MLIYKVTNQINGLIYIGQTSKTLEERKRKHENESLNFHRKSVKFHNALLKYGFDNFTWEVLRCCINQEELDYWEKYYIDYYKSYDRFKGYNLKLGGKTGGVFTEESKLNLGKSTKLKWQNPECAEKMLNGLRKGTETVKERSKLNFIEHVCPVCNKIFKTKNYNYHKYCSLQCANIDNTDNLRELSKKASYIVHQKYLYKQKERYILIKEWCFNNTELIESAKLNDLKFLKDLAVYIGVKDTRSLGKVLGVRYKKDILLQLKNIIKCTPNL